MFIDNNSQNNLKGYCRTLLASEGKLTRELYDSINNADESVIKSILQEQKQKIIDSSNQITNETNKRLILSQANSVQEVIDALPSILNA